MNTNVLEGDNTPIYPRLPHQGALESYKRYTYVCLILWMLCPRVSQAAAVDAETLGYIELRGYGYLGQGNLKDIQSLGSALTQTTTGNGSNALGFRPDKSWGAVTRTRPTLKLHFGEQTLVATPQAVTTHGFFQRSANELQDIITIERLYLSLSRGDFDVSIGKQLLTFGSGLLLNPTDTFNQRNLSDLNAELPGVWATRVLWAPSDTSNIQLAVALDERVCCAPLAFLRYDTTISETDIATLATYNGPKNRLDLGVDIKSEWVVGAWIEAVASFDLRDERALNVSSTFELGVDYSFDVLQGLYLAMEWIHQGSAPGGAWRLPNDPKPNYLMQRLQGQGTTLLAPNYLVLLSRLSINEELQANLMGLLNIADPSGIALTQLVYWPTGATELIAGIQYAGGAEGTETNMVIPRIQLVPESLRGQRLNPQWSFWLWGKVFF